MSGYNDITAERPGQKVVYPIKRLMAKGNIRVMTEIQDDDDYIDIY